MNVSERLPEKNPKTSFKDFAKQAFDSFRKRPDQPKYSYELQNKLEELSRSGPESAKEFIKGKKDKKHISAVWPPLEAAKLFLSSKESDNIPVDQQIELYRKIEETLEGLERAREEKHISDELVQQVLAILKEVEYYF